MMKKIILLMLVMSLGISAYAQQKVSGTITDASGVPLTGASIVIKSKSLVAIADIDGKWVLDGVESGDILNFTYFGFVPQDVTVGKQSVFNIILQEDALMLDDVVVVGYGVQKKALVTGANVNVKGDKIEELKPTTAMEALQGVVPGLSITRNSGAPGAGTKVTIRGMGTIGDSDPLYIVDGVAVNDINYLNPSDIESIDVLKDAASAAIYGARAANGVVLVTTKRAKAGLDGGTTTSVSYEGYVGFQNTYKTLPTLNAQEYMFIMDESRVNQGLAPFDWENMIKSGNTFIDNTFGAGKGAEYGNYVWGLLENGWEGTDWVDEITTENAPMQNHALNIMGNNKDFNYNLGISYTDQSSILGADIIDAGYTRLTARLNSELIVARVGDRSLLTIGENFTYTNTES